MDIKLVLVILAFCLGACQESDEQPGALISAISGSWQGILKTQLGAQEQVSEVRLSLDADRSFMVSKIDDSGVATGTYDEFPQMRSLTLRVEQSEVPEFGMPGRIRDYNYEIVGGELMLSSSDSILRLKRPQESPGKSGSSQVWWCSQDNLRWQLSLLGEAFFLYLENEGGASIFMKGTFSVSTKEDGGAQDTVLFVTDSQPVEVFNKLLGSFFYENGDLINLKLIPFDDQGRDLEPMSCQLAEDE